MPVQIASLLVTCPLTTSPTPAMAGYDHGKHLNRQAVSLLICLLLALTVMMPNQGHADAPDLSVDLNPVFVDDRQAYLAGLSAAKSDRIGEAIAIWTPLADAGHTEAQYALGLIYSAPRGPDFAARHDLAHSLYTRAAKSGHVGAVFELAFQFERGLGTDKDMKKAMGLYHIAAFQNHLNAQFNLAILMANGNAGKPDYKAAYVWALAARHNAVIAPHPKLGYDRINTLVGEIRARLPHGIAIRASRTATKLTGQPV